MNFYLTILLVGLSINGISGYVKCENGRGGQMKWNFHLSPRLWICCGKKIQFKSSRDSTCCIEKAYNPFSQICCGGTVYPKQDINSACCDGKFYQRGTELCCGKQLINMTTQGCCRNVPFTREYEQCCNGERVPNLIFDNTVEPTCCKNELFNPKNYICCANQISPRIAGSETKCCESTPYDNRVDYCCNGKIIRKDLAVNKECCGDILIDPTREYCCGDEPFPRNYTNMGCCRIAPQTYEPFNADNKICCAGDIENRPTKSTSCCGTKAYDVNTEICCGMRVHRRHPQSRLRCCGPRPYNAERLICCGGRYYPINQRMRKYLFCCGKLRYDRRSFKCVKGNRLESLKVDEMKRKWYEKF